MSTVAEKCGNPTKYYPLDLSKKISGKFDNKLRELIQRYFVDRAIQASDICKHALLLICVDKLTDIKSPIKPEKI